MTLKIANLASSKLASAVAVGDTTVTVLTGEGDRFPTLAAGEWFPLVLVPASGVNPEIVRATARNGDTITVARGQENTTALVLAANDRVSLRMTKAAFDEFTRRSDALANVADATGTANAIKAQVTGVTKYADKTTIAVRTTAANSAAAVTLNVNGLGPIPIKRQGSVALLPGSLQAKTAHEFVYSSDDAVFVVANPYPIEHKNPDFPIASTQLQGLSFQRSSDLVSYNPDTGSDSGHVSERGVSKIVQKALSANPENTLPYAWRNRGNLTTLDVKVLNGNTYDILAGQEHRFNNLEVEAGGLLRIVGNGVAVIRCEETFKLTAVMQAVGRATTKFPVPCVGPTSGESPQPGNSVLLEYAQARPNHRRADGDTNAQLSAREFQDAVRGGVPLSMFHGGGAANYLEAAPGAIQSYANRARVIYPGAPGIIIIAKRIEIAAGAKVLGLHGEKRVNFTQSGDAQKGPASGGILCMACESSAINSAAEFELGLKAGETNSINEAASGPKNAAYWLAKASSNLSDEPRMSNGQVFLITTAVGQLPVFARLC